MPSQTQSLRTAQQKQQTSIASTSTQGSKKGHASSTGGGTLAVPEEDIKKSSSVSASLALQAAKQAYNLRQAAYGAGNSKAREEILAKAIDKEIEAESFGKAAKYTRSGAFQGLAAGAGIGVQPGATLGKVTGALVGGVVSSVGALLGGGIGSAYGAISGPFWDLGQIASQGVTKITGEWLPDWEATSSQKKALEKMVLGAQKTQKPSQEELEQMESDDGGATNQDREQFTRDLTSWIPSVPSMPSMPSMPSLSALPSISGLVGKSQGSKPGIGEAKTAATTTSTKVRRPKPATTQKPIALSEGSGKPGTRANSKSVTTEATNQPSNTTSSQKPAESKTKKMPKKLSTKTTSTTSQPDQASVRRAPPKLGPRKTPATSAA